LKLIIKPFKSGGPALSLYFIGGAIRNADFCDRVEYTSRHKFPLSLLYIHLDF